MSNELTQDDLVKALQEQLSKRDQPEAADMSFKDFKSSVTTGAFTRALANMGAGEGAPATSYTDFDSEDQKEQLKRLAQSLNQEHKGDAQWKALDESGKMTPDMFKQVERLRDEYDSANLSAAQQKTMIAFVEGKDMSLEDFAKKEGIDANDKRAANLALIKDYKNAENHAHSEGTFNGDLQYKDPNYKPLNASSAVMDKETLAALHERGGDPAPAQPDKPKLVIDVDPKKVIAGDKEEIAKLKGEVNGHTPQEIEQYAKDHGISDADAKKLEAAVMDKTGPGEKSKPVVAKTTPSSHGADVASFAKDVEKNGHLKNGADLKQDAGLAGKEVVEALGNAGLDVSALQANLNKKGEHGVVDDAVMQDFIAKNKGREAIMAKLETAPGGDDPSKHPALADAKPPKGDPGIGGDDNARASDNLQKMIDMGRLAQFTKLDEAISATGIAAALGKDNKQDLEAFSKLVKDEEALMKHPNAASLEDIQKLLESHKQLGQEFREAEFKVANSTPSNPTKPDPAVSRV